MNFLFYYSSAARTAISITLDTSVPYVEKKRTGCERIHGRAIYMCGWCMELSTVLCAVMCCSAVYSVGDGFGGYIGCRCEWELDLYGG